MSKLRAFVYVLFFAAAAFVVWQYQATEEVEEPEAAEAEGEIEAGTPWLAMELVRGNTLRRRAGKLSWAELHFLVCGRMVSTCTPFARSRSMIMRAVALLRPTACAMCIRAAGLACRCHTGLLRCGSST